MMRRILLFLTLALAFSSRAEDGSVVIVVYNSKMPASKKVADHYAEKRSVPKEQVIGLELSEKENISRDEYRTQLAEPLLRKIEELKLITFKPATATNSSGKKEEVRIVDQSKIRYAALCYGVPLKIDPDSRINEPGSETARAESKRNEAAVDNELAILPMHYTHRPLGGPIQNRLYASTNAAFLNPSNGLLMVARLDGPTPEVAMGLVDKALEAERDGLWGRAYFDTRSVTNAGYKIGDDMILAAEKTAFRHGFETTIDKEPGVFPDGFPMSQIALYVGWYEFNVAGAMARPTVEFRPGAFAYHLHSFSAQTIRNPNERWVGPLLARGATATMGCTEEPYLEGTPDISVFIGRWLFMGYSFAEAAYACMPHLSWQTTVVGDPLYRPFEKKPQQQHEDLVKAKSKLVEWSVLRAVNINLAAQFPTDKMIDFLNSQPETKTSSILSEKLGDILKGKGKWIDAMDPYERALTLNPSPQQRLRIALALAPLQTSFGRGKQAYEIYQGLLKDYPDYPNRLTIYQKILPLADQFGKPSESAEYQKALQELQPPKT